MNSFKMLLFLLIFQILIGCIFSAGTLGGFEPITFPTSKKKLDNAVDSLFAKHPEYHIPEKWQYLNTWEDRGYGFLQSYIFYFENRPEEMYYVSYIGDDKALADPTNIQIAIRSINNGRNRWLLHKDLTQSERDRIVKRFRSEIILKLEYYSKVKAKK